jgi:hypothetical protein
MGAKRSISALDKKCPLASLGLGIFFWAILIFSLASSVLGMPR